MTHNHHASSANSELRRRYRQNLDPVEIHYQIIWLLAQGKWQRGILQAFYSRTWIYELVQGGYNQVGPICWRTWHQNQGCSQNLQSIAASRSITSITGNCPDWGGHGIWAQSGRLAGEVLGIGVMAITGLGYCSKQMGAYLRVSRPQHRTSEPEGRGWKKTAHQGGGTVQAGYPNAWRREIWCEDMNIAWNTTPASWQVWDETRLPPLAIVNWKRQWSAWLYAFCYPTTLGNTCPRVNTRYSPRML